MCQLHIELPVEQEQLNQFIKDYDSNEAIKWYTKASFLFRVLNRALRTQNIDNIFKLRYFLQDLYKQMESEYVKQRQKFGMKTVYHGQLMYRDDFDVLLKNSTNGSLIAFNSFLSTTSNVAISSIFAGSQTNTINDEIPVIFKILLNFDKTKLPLAYIGHLSAIDTEEETLAAMSCVFQIDQIVENKQEQRWYINLTLNEEVNERLTAMIDQLKEEMGNQSTLMILGRLLLSELPHDHSDLDHGHELCRIYRWFIKAELNQHVAVIGHSSDALNAYHQMTSSSVVTHEIIKALYNQGRSYMELEQNAQALTCFNEILSKTFDGTNLQDQAALADHSIGQMHDNEQAFRRALQSYMTALDIWMNLLKTNSKVNRHIIAQLLNDIAEIHDKKRRYAFALWYYA